MVRYSEELIDEIKSSNDIVDTISQYVTLKRSGRNFFGLCPFHKEKSPSFSVSPATPVKLRLKALNLSVELTDTIQVLCYIQG